MRRVCAVAVCGGTVALLLPREVFSFRLRFFVCCEDKISVQFGEAGGVTVRYLLTGLLREPTSRSAVGKRSRLFERLLLRSRPLQRRNQRGETKEFSVLTARGNERAKMFAG